MTAKEYLEKRKRKYIKAMSEQEKREIEDIYSGKQDLTELLQTKMDIDT